MIEKLLKDSDGYLSVYESEFHDQVGIGCENIQNNDFLKIPRDWSSTSEIRKRLKKNSELDSCTANTHDLQGSDPEGFFCDTVGHWH